MKRGLALIACVAIGLCAVAVAGAKNTDTTITGAGSTFVAPLVSTWTPAIGNAFGYTLQYSGVGSGAGIAAITNRQVDFGASDAPLSPAQAQACNGCVQIPWALAGRAMPLNIPGLGLPKGQGNLHLSGNLIAKIYIRQITHATICGTRPPP